MVRTAVMGGTAEDASSIWKFNMYVGKKKYTVEPETSWKFPLESRDTGLAVPSNVASTCPAALRPKGMTQAVSKRFSHLLNARLTYVRGFFRVIVHSSSRLRPP